MKAMNLVTLKCQYLNGNNSVISASVIKFFNLFGMKWTFSITWAQFYFYLHKVFFDSYLDKDF
jgi:hypothetical protein